MLKPGFDHEDCGCAIRLPPAAGADIQSEPFVVGPTDKWNQPGGPGTPAVITYGFINYTADLPIHIQRGVIRDAFGRWAAVSPLHFVEVGDSGLPWDDVGASQPNIRIGWFTADHGDGEPFDGANGVLAHAFFPPPNGVTAAGDIHFDDAEVWATSPTSPMLAPTVSTTSGGGPFDLNEVATHEIGHSLGLDHEEVQSSVMQPTYSGTFTSLFQDDIDGIRSLYGAGAGSVTPMPFQAPFDGDISWRITANELLSYASAHLNSEVWPAQGIVAPVSYVLRAATIWQSRHDGGYRDAGGAEPSNWVSSQPAPIIATTTAPHFSS